MYGLGRGVGFTAYQQLIQAKSCCTDEAFQCKTEHYLSSQEKLEWCSVENMLQELAPLSALCHSLQCKPIVQISVCLGAVVVDCDWWIATWQLQGFQFAIACKSCCKKLCSCIPKQTACKATPQRSGHMPECKVFWELYTK